MSPRCHEVGRRRRKRPQLELWRTISGTLVGIMGIQEVRDVAPILHAPTWMAFPGRGIIGQPLARLLALADPGARSWPAPRPAPTRRAETLVVLADGRRPLACRAFGAAGLY